MDRWARYKKCDDFRVAAPKSVSDLVEIKSIAENGIFEIGKGGIFTKTYAFDDINYQMASTEKKRQILANWCQFLNANRTPFQITVNNKNKNQTKVREDILFAERNDGLDSYRDWLNEEMEYTIVNGREGIEQCFYLTIRYEASANYEDAANHFQTFEKTVEASFRSLGSFIRPLNASERLRVLHDFYRFGKEEEFRFDFREAVESGFDFKDAIVGSKMDFRKESYFTTDDTYVSALYLKRLPSSADAAEKCVTDLAALNIKMMISIDCVPIADSDVDRLLKECYMGIESRIRKQNLIKVKEMDFRSDISLTVQTEKEEVTELIRERREKNQHYFYTMMNLLVIADSEEELKSSTSLVIEKAASLGCVLDYSYLQQKEAMNTTLPIGVRQVKNGRNLKTNDLATLFPFNTQELSMPGGNWYGFNTVSKNINIVNRKKLQNANGFIFGTTGSGKTVSGCLEIFQTVLRSTKDDVIVIDPKNDYEAICRELGGAYLKISATTESRYNPFEFFEDESKVFYSDVADAKIELVLALMERVMKAELSGVEEGLCNKALKLCYMRAEEKRKEERKAVPYNFYISRNHYFENGEEYYLWNEETKVYFNDEFGRWGTYSEGGNFIACPIQPEGYFDEEGTFHTYVGMNEMVTLRDLFHAFEELDHPAARDLKEALETFVDGSLNMFSECSNVDLAGNRIIMFGMKDMGSSLRDVSMLFMLEVIKERINENNRKGIATWLYIDEFHELLHTSYTQSYLKKLWMTVRSLGGICTGLTQNVSDILLNDTTKAMLENSEFLMILRQKESATEYLRYDLGLSDEMISLLIQNAEPGKGILRAGKSTVSFDWTIRKENPIYDKVNTNFHEMSERRREEEAWRRRYQKK